MSYAAIALLAVLALGIALLGTLRSYYRQQELFYLTDNATAIAEEISPLLAAGEWPALDAKIGGYAFLTQTRIQVLGETDQELLADSGPAAEINPAISIGVEEEDLVAPLGSVAEEVMIVVEKQQKNGEGEVSSQRIVTRTTTLPAQGSLYGFTLGGDLEAVRERSDLVVEMPINNSSGELLGLIRLSQGPAYGRDIVRSVASGWVIAGTVAVIIAAVVGWLVSRRLTQPLQALTVVTGLMAEGDLGARADVYRTDELGYLGHSFNRMAEQVENTVKSLRQFTADAAHELHTPLTALQTDLQLLAGSDDPQQQQRVARAQDQARRLQDLADSLLELSWLQAGTRSGVMTTINLTNLVQTIGEIYASQAEQADLAFEMQLAEQEIRIYGDETQLQRALVNILDNSMKFTRHQAKLILSLALENDTVVITVQDTGIGIPLEDRELLFSRFHRGRNTAGYPGSGLGLAIVQEIMLRHQGRVIA